jgi:hypothetical protein
MSEYALVKYDEKIQRTVISIKTTVGDNSFKLWVDDKRKDGTFEVTGYGTLYRHTDGEWGYPGGAYGLHDFRIKYRQPAEFGINVMIDDPLPTLGNQRIWPAQNLLPYLWNAGFKTETQLLSALAIAVGEGGLYTKARNWLPSSGFRPSTDVIGVLGPESAWNSDHTRQGHSDRGLFQINSRWHFRFSDAECDDPTRACQIIYEMSANGTNFEAWGFGEGASYYSKYWDASVHGYPALRPLVQQFLVQHGG